MRKQLEAMERSFKELKEKVEEGEAKIKSEFKAGTVPREDFELAKKDVNHQLNHFKKELREQRMSFERKVILLAARLDRLEKGSSPGPQLEDTPAEGNSSTVLFLEVDALRTRVEDAERDLGDVNSEMLKAAEKAERMVARITSLENVTASFASANEEIGYVLYLYLQYSTIQN